LRALRAGCAVCGGEPGGPLARVSLLDVAVCQLDVLPARFLYLLGESLFTCSLVHLFTSLRSSSLAGLTPTERAGAPKCPPPHAPWIPSCCCVRRVAAPREPLSRGSTSSTCQRVHYGRLGLRSSEAPKSSPSKAAEVRAKSWIISSNTPALSHRWVCW
jgi:hypothetical protein